MNRRQSLEKGILSPPGPFLTPSPSPSVQHSPRLQQSPSQSPFQQDVLLVTNNNQNFINTFNTTQEQDRKSGTPNRRLSLNHISPNAGTIAYRPSPTQSPAGITTLSNVGNEFNTTLIGSNNISLNKKGKRTPQHAGQYGSTSNSCSPKASKKAMGLMGSPIASPSPSPTPNSQPIIQQFPIINSNNSIVFMQQPSQSQRASIIQTSNAHQNHVYASSSNVGAGNVKHNKTPQQILPKPAGLTVTSNSSTYSSSLSTPNMITSATSTKQIVTQSKMAIVQQSNQTHQFQSPPHQSQQLMTNNSSGNSSPSPQPHQVTQTGSILLPSGAQPLLLNQMPVLVQQNTPQGVQLILRPPSAPQLATPGLVIHNRPTQIQQHQPQQLLRILNTNGAMQLTTANATPTFIVSSQANIIQQNLQSIKAPTGGTNQLNQISGIQQGQQQSQRQPQQIITNSHILGQSVAQIQNLQLNGNITQLQMANGMNGQFIQQLPAQFQQNLGGFNQIQPMGSQLSALTNATFQSPSSSNNSQNDIGQTVSTPNQLQFTSNQQNNITVTQGTPIISPVATPQPQMMQSEQSILSSPPSISYNTQPQTAVILTGDKQIHGISSPPPQLSNFSIIHQSGTNEMITLDMSQHQQIQQRVQPTKAARKPKKSKKQKALEAAQQKQQEQQQQYQQVQMTQSHVEQTAVMMSPNRNSQAPTGKLDLANVMKLCGIMEDDDFMDSDDQPTENMETQHEQETMQISTNCNGGENNPTDIMITIPGGSADQPFTFTIPSSSLEKSDGTIIQGSDGKMSNNVPFMIRFDPSDSQNGGQPYTISIPNFSEENVTEEGKSVEIVSSTSNSNPMCVPSFVNSVLNSSVTPTIQSQINEIQNQLMGLPQVASAKTTTKAPRQKKQSTKKSKKQVEKLIEVPTQIGNIQISQIDGTSTKTALGNKNINNQIQIMPILDKMSGGNHQGQIIEKQKMQVPVMQQTISQQNNQQHNNQQHHQNHHNNSQSQHSNSVPSQVNINVQQNQLINVTNNLQMQVIANPQQQQHNSGATPAHAPPTSSSGHQTQPHNTVVTSQSLNTQNLIGNIINAQQGQQTGNIIIQGGNFNQQQQQNLPANIQVNIQNQTIANNIITTGPVNHNNQQHHQQQQQQQQQPTAQSILSQLTGNLVLSLSEDGRLILRHDPNIPQDAQSNMILQTILTGALGNVSLINEPLKTPMPQLNHQQSQQQQHVIGSNGKIQHVSSVQNKNVIITSQAQPQMQSHQQQIFNNVMHSHTMPSHVIHNNSQQIQVQSNKTDNSNNQQQVVMPNPNILKFVELPKIQPNQQLFSLNTITNEITQLNPNQTTAALSPMERLLIVPSGINAQQLAQCLSQGQIHFNNIGQAPTTDPNKVQQQLQIQQQQQQNQLQVSNKSSNIQKVNQYIKKEPTEPKQKKPRGKKAKLLEEQQKIEIKKEPMMIQSPPPMKVITDTKFIKASTITTSTVTTTMNTGSKNTITISPNPTLVVNPPKVTPKVMQINNSPKMNLKQNSISVIPTTTMNKQGAIKAGKNNQIKTAMAPQLSPIVSQQQAPPPLVSVNQAPMPRVQTIQLTPQKQQSLKNVQMSIQQLSAKLQNKNLLATLTADVDPNNPAHNNPLPVLNNINTMSDSDIYNALQRLFVEQQKILATGKIIPTIPAAAAAAVSPQLNHSSVQQPQRNLQNSTQPIFANNFNIVAPIPSTSSSISSTFSSGNLQTMSSPIQVNSPVVKQEPLCSASTSSSQPPPLVVSTPIQMQIKTEILMSPTNVPVVTTSPPATGSIIISPKYTTAVNKITIDPPKEQKVFVEHKNEVVVQQPDPNIEAENVIKQQRILAAIEANRKLKITRSSLFEQQICVDQDGCTKPEYKTDFYSKEDAVKRLIRYHCLYDEIKNEHDPSEEYKFEEQAKMFIASYKVMQKKYQHLLMKQSQQQAPTSELMMLDRLRVADLKDEIVSMQAELNSVLFEQHQKSQTVVKVEASPSHCQQNTIQQQPKNVATAVLNQTTPPSLFANSPQLSPRIHQNVPILHEPSQMLKAKQEQKLFENIKNEKVKVEIPEVGKSFVFSPTSHCQLSPSPKSPATSHQHQHQQQQQQPQPKLTKFDKLKNDTYNVVSHTQSSQSQVHSPNVSKPQPLAKPTETKEELENFDIESEIRPNLIMKKYESSTHQTPVATPTASKKATKQKDKEREFSPLGDYFNPKVGATSQSKSEVVKSDGTYDEWLSIQKELNLQLTSSNPGSLPSSSKKETKNNKSQAKILENDLSEIFEHRSSPKSVEKQLDDLFSSASKSNELLASPSPLTEFFHVDASNLSEKTVENRLEALFGGNEEDSRKSTQQDLVETRLEQLFQGSVAENDESALDNASFLYKNTDMTYEMIHKQIHVSTSSGENTNASNSNKRQWSGTCDIFTPSNSSMMFPVSTSPSSKRACTTAPSVAFDNKWIEDSFDFATEIMSTESPGNDIEKHRNWNGNIDHQETMIGGLQSPHQDQFHLSTGSEQHQSLDQNMQQNINMMPRQDQLMETGEIPSMNYDDVDDISRQVQNAIDSILNLQSSDPLHYQLDSSFLELNTITASSGAPNSPMNIQHSHSHQIQNSQHHNQYQQMHSRTDHQINLLHEFNSQKPSSMPKRKYSRLDDIGDCLIGGSSLDDSPSALVLNEPHSVESSSASVGEFVNNLLNCEEKSITTS